MATYTIRGTSHNVVYTYKAADGKRKQQWESYSSELEAIQRKAYIDYLQSQNRTSDITHEASEYRRKKAVEKAAQKIAAEKTATAPDTPSPERPIENLWSDFFQYTQERRISHLKPMTAIVKIWKRIYTLILVIGS